MKGNRGLHQQFTLNGLEKVTCPVLETILYIGDCFQNIFFTKADTAIDKNVYIFIYLLYMQRIRKMWLTTRGKKSDLEMKKRAKLADEDLKYLLKICLRI